MKRLFTNATFVTMVDDVDTADALLVDDDGRIAYIGDAEEARRLADGAEEVDLGGAAVLPGLIDPHSHFTGALQYLLYADLSECTSFDEITETLKKFAAERNIGPDGVIMGNGYDQNNLVEQRHPDKSIPNAVSTDVPVLITHMSNHMGVANDCLLELAGITPTTPDPDGGRYGRINGSGDLDGYAEEPAAMNPLYAVTTPRLGLDFAAMVPDMQRIYLEHGVTTCQDGATAPDMAGVLVSLAKAGLLKMDIVSYPMWGSDVMATLADNAEFDSQHYTGHFRFGGLKMFLDGSPPGAHRLDDRALHGRPRRREGLGGLQHHDRRGRHRLREDGHRLQPPASVPLQRRRSCRPALARLRSGAGRFGQPGEDGPAPGDDPRPDGAHRPVREDGRDRHDPLDLRLPRLVLGRRPPAQPRTGARRPRERLRRCRAGGAALHVAHRHPGAAPEPARGRLVRREPHHQGRRPARREPEGDAVCGHARHHLQRRLPVRRGGR